MKEAIERRHRGGLKLLRMIPDLQDAPKLSGTDVDFIIHFSPDIHSSHFGVQMVISHSSSLAVAIKQFHSFQNSSKCNHKNTSRSQVQRRRTNSAAQRSKKAICLRFYKLPMPGSQRVSVEGGSSKRYEEKALSWKPCRKVRVGENYEHASAISGIERDTS